MNLEYLTCLLDHKKFMSMRKFNVNQIWNKTDGRLNAECWKLTFKTIATGESKYPAHGQMRHRLKQLRKNHIADISVIYEPMCIP